MIKFEAEKVPANLESWGSISELGAEVIEGDVQAFGAFIVGTHEDAVSCCFFACTKGVFRMTYPYTEHANVIEGSVTLTNETTREKETFYIGDTWYIEKGTPVLWEIHSERFVKNYLAIV